MIFQFSNPQSIFDSGLDLPTTSIIQSLCRLTEVADLVQQIRDKPVAEFKIENQPHFKLFSSHYEPILQVYSANDMALECAWSPGNMTRYEMLISLMPSDGTFMPLLSWLERGGIGGKSVLLVTHDTRYLMDKMNLRNDHDFLPMMDLVYLLGLLDIKRKEYCTLEERNDV